MKRKMAVDRSKMPYPLTKEWFLANGGTQEDIDSLRQTAHKDACVGPLKNCRLFSPMQLIAALSADSSIYFWVDESECGNPYAGSKVDWLTYEREKVEMKKFDIEKWNATIFHGYQTHAGDGEESNFRLFIGISNMPSPYVMTPHSQAYYEVEDKTNYGEYIPAHQYFTDREDILHNEEAIYPEYFEKCSIDEDTRTWTRDQLASVSVDCKKNMYLLADHVAEMYQQEASERQ